MSIKTNDILLAKVPETTPVTTRLEDHLIMETLDIHEPFRVELDDDEMGAITGGTSVPCGTVVITTVTQCFSDTAIWGSCRLGTRACC